MFKKAPVALLLVAACAAAALAQFPAPVEGDFVISNFRFTSGETLPQLRLHYRTIGKPERYTQGVVRNAVLDAAIAASMKMDDANDVPNCCYIEC